MAGLLQCMMPKGSFEGDIDKITCNGIYITGKSSATSASPLPYKELLLISFAKDSGIYFKLQIAINVAADNLGEVSIRTLRSTWSQWREL